MKLKKGGKVIILSVAILIVTGIVIYINLFPRFNRVTKSPISKSGDRNESWKSDIEFVKTELPKKHKNLFFSKSESDFNNDMDSLISKIEEYTDEEIKAELAKVIVTINDSHTSVNILGSLSYPIAFFQFENDIYVSDASLDYKDYWGKKLVEVNGYSVEEIRSKLDPFVSKDNKAITKNQFSNLLRYVEPLKFIGVVKDTEAVFTFEGESNNNVTVKPVETVDYKNVKFLSDDSDLVSNLPLTKQNGKANYWFDYIENDNLLYVKYNSCTEMKDYSFLKFTKDVFEIVDSKNIKKLVIDLRDNGGGNSGIFNPFLSEIVKRENVNKKENLYVIIGRKTFSSATLNAMELRNGTNVTLIGESTGGKPNHFGEVKEIHLTNTDIDIKYSSNFFKTSSEDTDSVYPDKDIVLKADSFFNGEDDILNYILGLSK
ncbi:S41 family peptidase [Clostridium gasigenes]|uniref:Peptidase family S41 n=1 Tax=Clostridium gasigenes TaxID=94869 RepID=A0A1H0U381_9CLOT|nr:S41 family peptidase [Clostridium gasigenes]SDP60639.1 Peptidase family S41 [Clostridium gasigenes]